MVGALTVINRLIGIRVLGTPVIILGNTHNIWVLWRPTMPTQLDHLAIMMKKVLVQGLSTHFKPANQPADNQSQQ